jgi:hypothetical protein
LAVKAVTAAARNIHCRQIGDCDLDAVADLLVRGFPNRGRAYWRQGLERQGKRSLPGGLPRYGYLLEADGKPVGVVLALYMPVDGTGAYRCNLSSWYVTPPYRGYASLLVRMASKRKEVTYLNISPAPHTWTTVEAQGFVPYCKGQFFSVPALTPMPGAMRVEAWDRSVAAHAALAENELMTAHAQFGCLTVVSTDSCGTYPFVFQPLRIRQGRFPLPCMRLIYCRDIAEFVRCAGPLGRFLLKRGYPSVVLDANEPIRGLVGAYLGTRGRKYFRGPCPPRLGDLAYTELAFFGP